jgi:uridylate kinase
MGKKNRKIDSRETVVLSLGGSIMVPKNLPDYSYLKKLRKLLLKHLDKMRFIIICGGGRTARNYMAAAGKVVELSDSEKDWIGIAATRLNASLVKSIFREKAHPKIITNPYEKIKDFKEDILVAAGYLPGFSTDFDSTVLAGQFRVKTLVNLTDVDYVYNKNPKEHRDAKPIKDMLWKDFFKMFGVKFRPGMNVPFDPVAAKEAEKKGLKVLVVNGRNLDNLDNLLYGEIFRGTIIEKSA